MDGDDAAAAIKFRVVLAHNIFGAARAIGGGLIHFARIDLATNTINHNRYLLQLRMSVNKFANDLHLQN